MKKDDTTVIYTAEDFEVFKTREPPRKREEIYIPVVEYSLDGEFLHSFVKADEAAKFHNMSNSAIRNICIGKYLYSKKTNSIFLNRGDDIQDRLRKIKEKADKRTTCNEVYEYSLKGRLLFKWPNTKMAADALHIKSYIITSCCRGRKLFIDKRIFLYPEGDIKQRVKDVKAELFKLSKRKPRRGVDEYSLEGQFIKGFLSASEASRERGIHVSNITRCCYGMGAHKEAFLTAKGRIYLWEGDSISDRLDLINRVNKKLNKE